MHILLVDDHTMFREALLYVLTKHDSSAIVLEAANIAEAQQLISHNQLIDLVLLDIDLPGIDGLTALPQLRKISPAIPFVVLSASENPKDVTQALELGAVGYIPKTSSSHLLLTAIASVLAGDIYIPPSILGKLEGDALVLANSGQPLLTQGLTPRQFDVMGLMALGLSNKAIARQLNLSEGTVKLHVAAIMRHFNAATRTEAVMQASKQGLINYSKDATRSE